MLLVPALAAQAAGPASILAWVGLLILSAPLAIAFAALGVRHPVAGGVSAYVREGFGDAAAAVTGGCFLAAVFIGAPAVSLIGGYYVADLTGSGMTVATSVALAIFGVVLAANTLGLRVSSGLQLGLSSVLLGVIVVAVAAALPSRAGDNWTPFAPHGWWAAGTAASILVWLFVGWEAVAQLAGDFRNPESDLPRAMAIAFGAVTLRLHRPRGRLDRGHRRHELARAAGRPDRGRLRPGRPGRDRRARSRADDGDDERLHGRRREARRLARRGRLAARLARREARLAACPRRPLVVIAVVGTALLVALVAGLSGTDDLVRATSACFVAVYVLALGVGRQDPRRGRQGRRGSRPRAHARRRRLLVVLPARAGFRRPSARPRACRPTLLASSSARLTPALARRS